MKGYRAALLEFKFNIKVAEIEESLLDNKNYKPKQNKKEYLRIHLVQDILPDDKI